MGTPGERGGLVSAAILCLALGALPQVARAQTAKGSPEKPPPALQVSLGDRSPNVYAPGGTVTVNLVDIRNVIRQFDQLGQGDARQVARLLRSGRYEEARSKIDSLAERSASAIGVVAFLKYSQGLVAQASGKPVTAEREFAAAVALVPASCEYRGRLLLALATLDRRAEMVRLGGPDNPEAQQCLERAKPADRARFLAAHLSIAMEASDQPAATEVASAFSRAVRSSLASAEEVSWSTVVLTCHVAASASAIYPDVAHPDRQLLERLCAASSSAAARSNPSAARIFTFGPDFERRRDEAPGKGVQLLTEQIGFIERLAPIGEIGFGEVERRVTVARLRSSRGFTRRWAPNPDLNLVAADYRAAFEGLLPFASPRHPVALSAFAQLLSYIAHFDSMHPERALKLALVREVERSIENAREGSYERSPQACQSLARLQIHASSMRGGQPSARHRANLKTELGRCAATALGANTLSAREFQRYLLQNEMQEAVAGQRVDEALATANRLLALVDIDRDFPAFVANSQLAVRAVNTRAWALALLGHHSESRQAWADMAERARAINSRTDLRIALEGQYILLVNHFGSESAAVVQAAQALFDGSASALTSEPPMCFDIAESLEYMGYLAGALLASNESARARMVVQQVGPARARISACGQSSTSFFSEDVMQSVRARANLLWVDLQKSTDLVQPAPDGRAFAVDIPQLVKERDLLVGAGVRLPDRNFPLLSGLLGATGHLPTTPEPASPSSAASAGSTK